MTDQLPATTQPQRASVTAGGNVGALIPQDIEQAFRIAQALAHSGMTPNGFKTPETCFVAIMAGAELGLPPFQSLQSFAIINNRPTLWGDALVAVIRTNGFKMREWLEGEGDDMEAFCEVTRPDNGDVAEASFSVADAKTAGLWKKGGPWTTNPKRMLKMRARAFAIRDGAADVLRGFQIREEVEDYDTAALPVEERRAGTGLLAKLEATNALATEGFGVRDIEEEVTPEPEKPKRAPRKAKEQTALEAIAEAEPEIVQQVVEDHADETMTLGQTDAATEADSQPVEPQEDVSAAVVVQDGPAPSGEPYFHADKEAFPSGRRVAYIDGVAQADTPEDGTLPVYAEHAPEPVAPKSAPAAEGPAEPTPESPSPSPSDTSTSASNTASQDGGATTASPSEGSMGNPTDPFDIFDAALAEARDWPTLRPSMLALSHTPEWQARPDMRNNVRIDVWEVVSAWNDAGAKIDPADDALLFQAYLATSQDVEAIEGLYETAKVMHWLISASDGMKQGVAKFVANRVEEVKRGRGA